MRFNNSKIIYSALCLVSMLLSACGGGGAITAVANIAPVANAGNPQTVGVASLVYVNGAASTDANNDPLTYAWTLTTKPSGSTAALTSSTTPAANFATGFTADFAGTYVVTLVVNDGKTDSAATTVTITAVPDAVAGATWTYTPSTWAQVTDATVPNGGIVYKAATISNLQSATASTTITTAIAGSVNFYYKVDSEATYDKLTFTVDGVEPTGGHWSGLVPWNLATFPVATGTHILTWTYSKDAIYSTGLDTAWISQVSFGGPPPVIPSTSCTLNVQTYSGQMAETFSKVTRIDPTEDYNHTTWPSLYPTVPTPKPFVKLVTSVTSGSPFFCYGFTIVQGGRLLDSYSFTADSYGVDAGYATCATLQAGVSNIIYLKLDDPTISWFNPSLPFSITEETSSMSCSLY